MQALDDPPERPAKKQKKNMLKAGKKGTSRSKKPKVTKSKGTQKAKEPVPNISGTSGSEDIEMDQEQGETTSNRSGCRGDKADWAFMHFTPKAVRDARGNPMWAWTCAWCG
jgi:hypothetical protein